MALSSFKSEYLALGSASPEAIHLQNFCADLDSTYIRQPVIIFEDNIACIAMTKNPVLHEKQNILMSDTTLLENVLNGILSI